MKTYIPYPFNTPASVEVIPDGEGVFDTVASALPASFVFGKTIAENRFAYYEGESENYYLCRYPARGEIRKIICPENAYRHRPIDDTAHPTVNAPALYQIDLDNRRINCGMSYVYHLADGRFFIIDGGYFTYGERERLYSLLRSLTPEGKLSIAGWFFSHAHQDHLGCFIEFILKYQSEISIDALYYTFPSLSLDEAVRWKQSDNATMREFDYTVSKVLPNVKHIHPHTGDRFTLATTTFEVLFTHEDIYPESVGAFNNTSTILRATTEGQSILFLGDLQTTSCRKLEAMWGDYLKSDMIQVAHHGFNGSTIETYALASPTIALWPSCRDGYNDNVSREVNAFIRNMPSVEEHIIAGFAGTRRLSLPYTPNTSTPVEL